MGREAHFDETRWVDDFAEAWAREYPDAEDTSAMVLVTLLARLSVLIDAFQAASLKQFELGVNDYAVLAALRRGGPPYELAPSRLYTSLERSSGGMTKMLKRLEQLGFVRRVPDPDDRRSTLVQLTAAGKQVEEDAFARFVDAAHRLLEPASPADLDNIDDSLRRLLVIIERGFPR
ncbi:MAG: MarR family transcriptional regulator [Acidimicrobiia bacterium]|nr:MarR family transcriptional regulator [Acidimicrobiia bacterium]